MKHKHNFNKRGPDYKVHYRHIKLKPPFDHPIQSMMCECARAGALPSKGPPMLDFTKACECGDHIPPTGYLPDTPCAVCWERIGWQEDWFKVGAYIKRTLNLITGGKEKNNDK